MNTNVMFFEQNGFVGDAAKFGGCDNSAPFPSMIVTLKADAKEG